MLNFGGVSDLNYALDQPIDTAMQNVVGNLVALEACKQNKVRKFVLASTIYVNSREGGITAAVNRPRKSSPMSFAQIMLLITGCSDMGLFMGLGLVSQMDYTGYCEEH